MTVPDATHAQVLADELCDPLAAVDSLMDRLRSIDLIDSGGELERVAFDLAEQLDLAAKAAREYAGPLVD